jgi:hypothetical protein
MIEGVSKVEYRRPSVCSNGTVLYTNIKLQNDGDVRTMFSIFSQYMMNGPIELDAKLVRSVKIVCSNLICTRNLGQDRVWESGACESYGGVKRKSVFKLFSERERLFNKKI